MMRLLHYLALTVSLALPAISPMIGRAQDLKLPETVKGQPGSFVVIRAETDCKTVRWLAVDDGVSMLPSDLLKDSKAAIIFTPKAGRYRILAYTAKGDEPSEPKVCVLEIGDPVPPKPPTPPTPPPPTDPLAIKLQASFISDPAPVEGKKKQLAILYGVYAAMAEHCETDKTLATLGDVTKQLRKTADDMKLIPDALIECRKIIAAEVATLGTNPAATLDATLRASAVACFARISKALEQVN